MVTQDGVSVTDITVLPVTAAVVRDETTPLRTEDTIGSAVVKDLKAGDKLAVLETNGDWFRVQTADKSVGWVAVADLEVVSAQGQNGAPAATPQATPQG
jgi:uncharacterized protein YgiM (DUF1202 family)